MLVWAEQGMKRQETTLWGDEQVLYVDLGYIYTIFFYYFFKTQ